MVNWMIASDGSLYAQYAFYKLLKVADKATDKIFVVCVAKQPMKDAKMQKIEEFLTQKTARYQARN